MLPAEDLATSRRQAAGVAGEDPRGALGGFGRIGRERVFGFAMRDFACDKFRFALELHLRLPDRVRKESRCPRRSSTSRSLAAA
jgi:hypothetical protein